MINKIPTLKILPVADLIRHEFHDEQRSKPLIERLRASGVLRNPPIVSPLNDGTGRYMVLDGSNRSMSLVLMGIPDCICQVVEADDDGLGLSTWNHVLWNWDADKMLEVLQGMEGVKIKEIYPKVKHNHYEWPEETIVRLQFPNGRAYIAQSQADGLINRANKLSEIAKLYSNEAEIDRTTAQKISELDGMYENLCALVVYPQFKFADVKELTSKGVLLLSGVTRFLVSPRALRLNYSIEDLSSSKSIEEKNKDLDRWLRERTAVKGIRTYTEKTVLFDE